LAGARRHDRIDYLRHPGKRRQVAHLLKATNFRKLAGSEVYDLTRQRRRLILAATALMVLVLGCWSACR